MAQNDFHQTLSTVPRRPGILVQDTTGPSMTTFFYTSTPVDDEMTDIKEIGIPDHTRLLTSCEGLMVLYMPASIGSSPYLYIANSVLQGQWRCMLPTKPELRYCAIGRTRDSRKFKLIILCMNCGALSGWYVRTLGEDLAWRKLDVFFNVDLDYEYDLHVLSAGGVIYWTTSGAGFKAYAFDLSEEKFYITVPPLNGVSTVSYSQSGSRVLVGGFVTQGGLCTLIVPDRVREKLLVFRLTNLRYNAWMRDDGIFPDKLYREFVESRAKPVIWADHHLVFQADSRVVEDQIHSKLVMYLRTKGVRKTLVNPLVDGIHAVVPHTLTANWFIRLSQPPVMAPSASSHFSFVNGEAEDENLSENEESDDEDMDTLEL
uniref:Uncharacterized protein n=1 Tax=Kalanchoe fedtschenkoi TaxID=63787 RepID=A0A7N0UY41_KALFE